MQRASEQLLARAALTQQQHGCVTRRGASQRAHDLLERRVLSHDLRQPTSDRQLLLEQHVLGHDAVTVQRAGNQQQEVVRVDRLGEEVHRSLFHRLDSVLDAAVGGHHDDRDLGVELLGRPQYAKPVTTRQPEVSQYYGRAMLLQSSGRLDLVGRLDHRVLTSFQGVTEHRTKRFLLLDDQRLGWQRWRGARRHGHSVVQ